MPARRCVAGAYSYYSSKMNITNTSSSISTHDFRLNGEWEVYGTKSEWAITVLDCCPGEGVSRDRNSMLLESVGLTLALTP